MAFPQPPVALQGLRVLDLTRVRAGPTCTRVLADFGADVIKIEPPEGIDPNEGMSGARDGYDMLNLHRNKRSMTLNLKEPAGLEVFLKLAATADIVVENYRPDVKERLGFDYETLSMINPRIILASVSGFGQTGPYANLPGFDQIAQGMSGLMGITGRPGEGPMRAGNAPADSSAGLYAAIGILVALQERQRSGVGQWVHTSLLEAQIAMNDFQAARYLMDGSVPPQAGNDRAHQHRGCRGRPVAGVLQGDRRAGAGRTSGFRQYEPAVQAPPAIGQSAGTADGSADIGRMDQPVQRHERACRADLQDGRSVRRPAHRRVGHHPDRQPPDTRANPRHRPAGDPVADARPGGEQLAG
jgi:crotonobetainyl-CoA:carnitine CoA-transferase CaiB-like acyl-CoA transferase